MVTLSSLWRWLSVMVVTDSRAPTCSSSIICWISSAEAWVRPARLRTSSATTANPRPASPARAASIAALSASRLVCWEMPLITSRICPMFTVLSLSTSMLAQEALILPDSSFITSIVRCTTWRPSSACCRADEACCEASEALWAISCAAAPNWLIAAATLLVRVD
ncbi:hypothetical protein D3C85_889510 [compost metagenome]